VNVREFLRSNIGVIEGIYLDHEGGVLPDGLCVCHCGYRASEGEWLRHVADKIADALEGETVVELPLEVA
jgi:hypothetical protein